MSLFFFRNSTLPKSSFRHFQILPWKKDQFFSLGRTALMVGLESYSSSLKQGPILVPNFICSEGLQAFAELGLTTKKYDLDEKLTPLHLEQRVKETSAAALMIVHYFGIPQDMAFIQDICEKNHLILIEDNAHGFGGKWKGQRLGTFGDIAIHSLRKNFPLADGALLETKKSLHQKTFPPAKNFKKSFRTYLKQSVFSSKIFRRLFQHKKIKSFYSEYEPAFEHRSISESSYKNLDLILDENTSHKRRAQFEAWISWAKKVHLKPIFLEIDEASPLCCPVWATSIEDRDYWLKKLFVAGIDAYPWPTQTPERNSWEHLICLPINPLIELSKLHCLLRSI